MTKEPPKYEPTKILDGACHIGDPIGPQIPYLPGVAIPAPGTLPMWPPGTPLMPSIPSPSVSLTLTLGDLQQIIRSEVSSILDEKFSEWEERFKAIK